MARALALGLIAGGGGAALAQAVDALGQMRPGEYQIHEVGGANAPRTLCVTDTKRLLQLAHGNAGCTFRTITAGAEAATVRYVCPGRATAPPTSRFRARRVCGSTPRVSSAVRRSTPCTRPSSMAHAARA